MINSKRFLLSINSLVALGYLGFWIYSSNFNTELFDAYANIFYTIALSFFGLISLFAALPLFSSSSYFKPVAFVLALGLLANSVGEVLWYYSGYINSQIDYPSVADIWYVLFYPITFLGLHLFFIYINAQGTKKPVSAKFIYTLVTLFISLGLLFSFKFNYLGYFNSDTLDLAYIFDIIYMVCDALLIIHTFVIIGFLSMSSKAHSHIVGTIYLIGLSFVTVATADILFSYASDLGLYVQSNYIDTLFMLFGYFMSTSIIKVSSLQELKK